jgi:hypothetical protein
MGYAHSSFPKRAPLGRSFAGPQAGRTVVVGMNLLDEFGP